MRIDNLRCSSSFYSLHLKLNKINKKLKSWNLKYHKNYLLKYLIFYFEVLELISRIKKNAFKKLLLFGQASLSQVFQRKRSC